jgi:hypothetical protein
VLVSVEYRLCVQGVPPSAKYAGLPSVVDSPSQRGTGCDILSTPHHRSGVRPGAEGRCGGSRTRCDRTVAVTLILAASLLSWQARGLALVSTLQVHAGWLKPASPAFLLNLLTVCPMTMHELVSVFNSSCLGPTCRIVCVTYCERGTNYIPALVLVLVSGEPR